MSYKENINSRLTIEANKTEGGFSQDIIGSVAYELQNIHDTEIDPILDNAFIATADEPSLVKHGQDVGILRNEATNAYVVATITGADEGAIINTDIKAKADDLVFVSTDYDTIDSTGTATIQMRCETAGSIGNIQAGTLNEFLQSYVGFESATITNNEMGFDGFNVEPVETYRTRLLEELASDPVNSNIDDYKFWALDVAGVEQVVVHDATYPEVGAGNVFVYISAVDSADVSQALIDEVTEYIEARQIINAKSTILSVDYVDIDIDADIVLKDGYSFDGVKQAFTALLKEYLKTVTGLVSYLRISDILFSVDGVADVTDYTMNGAKVSINLDDIDVARVGVITIA